MLHSACPFRFSTRSRFVTGAIFRLRHACRDGVRTCRSSAVAKILSALYTHIARAAKPSAGVAAGGGFPLPDREVFRVFRHRGADRAATRCRWCPPVVNPMPDRAKWILGFVHRTQLRQSGGLRRNVECRGV